MSSYLSDIFDRLVAMEKEALVTVWPDGIDAVPYWPYQQDSFPYFINRLGTLTVEDSEYAEDNQQYLHLVLARLVTAHYTEGYEGDKEDKLYDSIAAAETYFRTHPTLVTSKTGTFPTQPDWLLQDMRLLGHTGFGVFAQGGLAQLQMGVEFTLEISIFREVY